MKTRGKCEDSNCRVMSGCVIFRVKTDEPPSKKEYYQSRLKQMEIGERRLDTVCTELQKIDYVPRS